MSEVAFLYCGSEGRTIVALLPERFRRMSTVSPEALGRAVASGAKNRQPNSTEFTFKYGNPIDEIGYLAADKGFVILDFYPGNAVTSEDVVRGLGYRVGNPGYCVTEYAEYPLRRSQWLPADETAIGPEGTVDEIEAIAWLVR